MSEPSLTETMQIGIVVPDLDIAIQHYSDDFGIGPWSIHEFSPSDIKTWREHGKQAETYSRIATTMVGSVQWELIQPLGDTGVFAEFLAEKGGGVHHIAVATANYPKIMSDEEKRGRTPAMECELSEKFSGIKVAYLDTRSTLGVLLEVFSGLPGNGQAQESE